MRRFVLSLLVVVAAVVAGIVWHARAAVGKDCGTAIGTFPTEPHKRPIHTPPAPGLVVTQIAPHAFRFDWTLPSSTAHCRPAWIVLRVFGPDKGFGPSDISVTALSGVNVVTVPDYFTVVNAGASSFTASFTESPVTSVAIRH